MLILFENYETNRENLSNYAFYSFRKYFFFQKILFSFNRVQMNFYNQRSNSFLTIWYIQKISKKQYEHSKTKL